jgi:hypothetical protein
MGNRCNCFAAAEEEKMKESTQMVHEDYKNGDTYKGKKKNGLRNGHGVYTYKNSSRYEGEYVDDLPNGNGNFYYSNGEMYQGQW